jgi:Protein of unknown function (DUF2510)
MAQGWYPDPVTVGAARYWDGARWTDNVTWGERALQDPTPIAEVERRFAATKADTVESYIADAEERGLLSAEVAGAIRDDLAQPATGLAPPLALPPPPPRAETQLEPRPTVAPLPPVVQPVRVQPDVVARWWGRAQDAVRTDLALHGLAYLGVLMMFVGVAGLILFSFGDISEEFRTLTELLVPTTLLVAGWYLGRRGASVVSAALTLLGAGLVPLVAVASVSDDAPLPPDVTGRALPIVHGAICLVIAVLMFAIVRRRAGATPLRFLWAPVLWLGAGLFAAIFRDEVPQGYDIAQADALQLGAALASIAVTVAAVKRWVTTASFARATLAVALPTAVSVYVLELILAGTEGWPVSATVISGLAVVGLVEMLADRFPPWSVTVAQIVVVAVTGARFGAQTDVEWSAAVTALVLLALVEYAGSRRPTAVGAWIGLGAVAVALLASVSVAGAGALGFGAVAVWALWRHVIRPDWLEVEDPQGFVVAAAVTIAVAELWRFGDAGPAVALTGAGVLAVALVGRLDARVGADLLWRWFTPAAAVALSAASRSLPWGDAPGWIGAGTASAAVALVLSPMLSGPKTWLTAAVSTWTLANLANAFELSRDTQAVGLAALALGLVVLALARDWPISLHLGFIGHLQALGAISVVDRLGWTATVTVAAATLGWVATSVVNEGSGASHVAWLSGATRGPSLSWTTLADDTPVLLAIGGSALTAFVLADAAGVVGTDDPWATTIVASTAAGAGFLVRVVPWRRAAPRVLAWATLVLSLGAAVVAPALAPEGSSWSVIACVALGVAVVAVASAPRPRVFGWVGWAECGILSVLVADRAGLAARWVNVVLISWGAVVLLGSLLVDRREDGPAPPGTFVRRSGLLAPAWLGVVAIVVGSNSALVDGTRAEIGWMSIGLALVALAAALLLSQGALAGLSEALAAVAFVLLAPWDPLEHPWSIVPVAVAVLSVAWMTWSPEQEQRRARWDIPSFVVAHGVVGLALVAAVADESVSPTFLAAGAVSVIVSVVIRRWPWAAAGAGLILVAAAEAGPGWLALALLVEGLALTVAGLQQLSVTRRVLVGAGAAAIVGSWFELALWQSWSVPTVLYATAPGAAAASVCAGLALRSRRVPCELAVVWLGAGSVTALVGASLVFHDDVARRPGGLTVAGALALVALAWGISASSIGPALRWVAATLLALAWVPGAWAVDPSAATVAVVLTLLAVGILAVVLAASAGAPSSPWVGPAALWAVLTQLGGAAAAVGDLPSKDLLIVVLLAMGAEFVALGMLASSPALFLASPASACAAWILYASDAVAGEANWFTMPTGVTLLVMVGLVRWIRASRGSGDVVGIDVVVLELIAMAFTVASPLAQTLAGELWNALLAIGISIGLAAWGVLTKVRRRVAFGALGIVVAVLFLIAVPLTDLGAWRGPGLWITVIAIGLAAVAVATMIERGRDRLGQIRHHLDDMTEGWERIGRGAPAKSS